MSVGASHIPVLKREVIHYLNIRPGGRYIDATVGAGGHAELILQQQETALLLGIDRDTTALQLASQRLAGFGNRVTLVHGNFAELDRLMADAGWREADGILMDLGMSSMQIDDSRRGFSFQSDGPLDMRMDRCEPFTASSLLRYATKDELAVLFREYGEERRARSLATAIVREGKKKPWVRTSDLAAFIKEYSHGRKHGYDATVARCFQALRIAVNDELAALESGLDKAIDCLASEGIIAVLSYHSLEDRIVKDRFRYEGLSCICPPDLPICGCDKRARLRILTKKPIRPASEECAQNRRSSSAKLRVAQRISA